MRHLKFSFSTTPSLSDRPTVISPKQTSQVGGILSQTCDRTHN
nr:hypothetical protein [Trichocoleus desertorum]